MIEVMRIEFKKSRKKEHERGEFDTCKMRLFICKIKCELILKHIGLKST